MMKKLINFYKKDRIKDMITVNLLINNYCNQNCSYCCVKFIKERNKYDVNHLYIRLLLKEYKKRKYNNVLRFNILGGEPTISPMLFKTLDVIYNYDTNITIWLTSNGKESIDYYKNLITNYPNLLIKFSYHPESADDKHFIDLLNLLSIYHTKEHYVSICLYYLYYNKIINFINKTKEFSSLIHFTKLAGIDYTNDINYKIFNDILKNYKEEYIYICEYDDNTSIELKELDLYNIMINTNIFKDMKCKNNYMWDILAEDYIKFDCSDKKFKLLPREINKFLDEFDKHKDGIICTKDKCDLECNLAVVPAKSC